MNVSAQKLTDDVLALPEDQRIEVFVRLASTLPVQQAQIVESARRGQEIRSGKVIPMSEQDFSMKVANLRQRFREQA